MLLIVPTRQMERRISFICPGIDIGFFGDEENERFFVALYASEMEGCAALVI